MSTPSTKPKILLTGATGYVGGRLLRALQGAGYPVRCMARRPEFLASRVSPETEIVAGDCLDASTLPAACAGVHTAYYLVHSMGSTGDFAEQDRHAALNFGAAARGAGIRRIIYLGGLADHTTPLSTHLRSRHETGTALCASGVPVIELRASIILGSGSLSFELIRSLVERLPIMLCPRWVRTLAQPIGIEDVLAYLLTAIDLPRGRDGIFEIGGADRVSYAGIMQEYARQRGLRRWMIPVPLLTPRLSSLWLGLTTPVYARVGRKLIESVENESTVNDDRALQVFGIRPMGLREAVRRAMSNEDQEYATTRWSDAISSSGTPQSWGGMRFGTRLVDSRTDHVAAPPAAAFAAIRRVGGATGWYYANWLWRLRGLIDLWAGGVGMRRGRRHPEELAVGDTVDFWRVESYEPDKRLRLAAEMKLPGRAWLEFDVKPDGDGALIRQTAVFDPVGLLGLLYWYGIYPLHARVFAGMLRGIALRAAQLRDVESSHPLVAVSRSSASATIRVTPQGSSSPLDATSPADDDRRTDSGPASPGRRNVFQAPTTKSASLRIDQPSPVIRALAQRLVAGATTPEARALACFRFVRDEIYFGFTPRFDLASAEETLVFGRGHCNPQATLFASLLHAAGVEARLHLVTISNEILAGIFPPPGGPPARLAHTFTEVRLAGEWRRVDGYIVDPMLHARAVPRLRAEGRRLGWGVHVDGRIDWDGRSDCTAQFVGDEMLAGPDHGTTLDPAPFFASAANPQRLGLVSGFLYRTFAVNPANRTLDTIRSASGNKGDCASRDRNGRDGSRRDACVKFSEADRL